MSATPAESHDAPDATGRRAPLNDDPIVLLLYGEEHVNLALADELELDGYEVRRASDAAKLRAVCSESATAGAAWRISRAARRPARRGYGAQSTASTTSCYPPASSNAASMSFPPPRASLAVVSRTVSADVGTGSQPRACSSNLLRVARVPADALK